MNYGYEPTPKDDELAREIDKYIDTVPENVGKR